MRILSSVAISVFVLIACSKSSSSSNSAVVDNGPLGGTYSFTSCNIITNDTTIEPSMLYPNITNQVAKETVYTGTSAGGKLIITKNTLKSEGLMWTCNVSASAKVTNLTTNVTTNGSYLPYSDTKGANNTNFSTAYTFSLAGSQMQIDDAQYIFVPAFLLLPTDKRYNYTLSGNTLTIKLEAYSTANRSRSVATSVFTKQ